jgi:glycosyltransferase involved in cell wall biosynthesis
MQTMIKDNNISLVIPCYNGGGYIHELYNSILEQNIQNVEILFIDDGSTDNSKEVIQALNDPSIKYYYQPNKGVSSARNFGLEEATGMYIVFFDVDDIMGENFLRDRLSYLQNNPTVDFVSGEIEKFSTVPLKETYLKGTSEHGVSEVLLFKKSIGTCPSNYMFKRSFLQNNKLMFNTNLASTADKYFILEASLKGRGQLVLGCGKLLYRVNQKSMSHHLTKHLVEDNRMFYQLTKTNSSIESTLRRQSASIQAFLLAASYYKIKNFKKAVRFTAISFFKNPTIFFKKIIRVWY